jgi:cell filamentation protein, protein adenylyltransferase
VILDPYADPVTGVLRNKLGCVTHEALRQAERDISRAALLRISAHSVPGKYDLDHLAEFHRAIFADIYPWAGEIRTIVIAKADVFCLPRFIVSEAERIFMDLRAENHLRGLRRPEFVSRLAHHLGEINALHPSGKATAARSGPSSFSWLARPASP